MNRIVVKPRIALDIRQEFVIGTTSQRDILVEKGKDMFFGCQKMARTKGEGMASMIARPDAARSANAQAKQRHP